MVCHYNSFCFTSEPVSYTHLDVYKRQVLANEEMTVLHGPPGTGKTTTLVECIRQKIKEGEQLLVSAPSNTAVDHLAGALLAAGVKILRLGNAGKANACLLYTSII